MHRASPHLPSISSLGRDLLETTSLRQVLTLVVPFALAALFFGAASRGLWIAAVPLALALSYLTYGSTSHDLVHRAFGLPPPINDLMLTLTELLALRSGAAYRLSHLQHHRRLGLDGDIEGAPAHHPVLRVLAEAPLYVPRLWLWAWREGKPRERRRIAVETAGAALLWAVALALGPRFPTLLVYLVLVTVAAWGFPIAFVVLPHDVGAAREIDRTRAFRGRIVPALLLQHLFHLEHHLYPMVPSHRWRELGRRLEPHLAHAGVRMVRIP